MVKDLELMFDISPLFEKKIIIWGMGYLGKSYYEKLLEIGFKEEHILLCDSYPQKCGENYKNHAIITPDELKKKMQYDDYALFIASLSLEIQDEILNQIDDLGLGEKDIYTDYGIRWGIYLNQGNLKIPQQFKNEKRNDDQIQIESVDLELQRLKFFTFAPIYDEMILVYQPRKVGSMSIHESILAAGKYALHVHELKNIQYSEGNIKKMAQMHEARIISLVRDPLARAMSLMWFGLRRKIPYHYAAEKCINNRFEAIQKTYFYEGFENQQFQWFNNEMEEVFGIDIYKYPFNKKQGYSIIEQDGIHLMILTTERINDLEYEIGKFLGIDNFKIESKNIGALSDYRFAYKEYKEKVRFKKSMLDRIYFRNSYIRHFYTDEMIDKFYHQWNIQKEYGQKDYDVLLEF